MFFDDGGSGEPRTHDLPGKSRLLLPSELHSRTFIFSARRIALYDLRCAPAFFIMAAAT